MKKQTGFLNILAVGIVIIMGLLSAALVNMIVSSNAASINIQAGNRAYDLAVSAVQAAAYQLTQSAAVCTGSFQATQTVTTGEYKYSCLNYLGADTLSAALTAGATTLSLASTTGFAPFGYVIIDSEIIYYNSVSGSTLSGLRRGMQATTAAAHLINAAVNQNVYVVTGVGGSPSITSPSGIRTINQAMMTGPTMYAADSAGVIYAYNGATWSQTANVSPANQINGISCSAEDNCWAVGNGGKFYFYNGLTWTTTTIGSFNVNSVSCTDTTRCMAVGTGGSLLGFLLGYGTAYTYSGGSWASANFGSSLLGGGIIVTSISCAATNNCYAGNNQTDIYRYSGSWGPASSRSQIVTALSCAGTGTCEGVGANGAAFHLLSSGNWSNLTPGNANDDFTSISCPTTTYCLASSSRPSSYTYNGASWSGRLALAFTVNKLSCFSSTNCLGGGTTGQFYSFDGTNWTASEKPRSNNITAMSLPIPGSSPLAVTFLNTQT